MKKEHLATILITIFSAMLTSFLAYVAFEAYNPGYSHVPSVVGLHMFQAVTLIQQEGFSYGIEYEDKGEPDLVVAQALLPGKREKRDTKITICVTRGLPVIPMPSGQRATLNNKRFVAKSTDAPAIPLYQGTVISLRLNRDLIINASTPTQIAEATLVQPILVKGKQLCMKGARAVLKYDVNTTAVTVIASFQVLELTLNNGDSLPVRTTQLTRVSTAPLKHIAMGTGIGAILGYALAALAEAFLGDIPDTIISLFAVGGAISGGTAVATADKQLTIEAGEIIQFKLTEDVFVNFRHSVR